MVNEFSALLKAYGVGTVRGDRYGGLWPRERFAVHSVEYRTADKPKSDLYRDLLPTLNSGRVELPDHPRLVAQLCGHRARDRLVGERTALIKPPCKPPKPPP